MDRPLPDRDSRRGPPPRRSRPPTYPRDNPRDNPRQNRKDERQDLDNDWVHDRYDDEPESRGNQSRHRGGRRDDYDRRSPPRQDNRDRDRDRDRDRERDYGRDRDREPDRRDRDRNRDRDDSGRPAPPPAKIRVDNLHYDLNEDDLEDLFTRIAPVRDVKLQFDRAGRSEGTAFVTYDHIADARTAVKEFDGANAKGQPIRLSILPLPPRSQRNPFDRAENPRSLFDRIDAPSSGRGRRRSESPMDGVREYSRNNSTRGGINGRRTDSARGGDDRFPPRGGRGRGGERGGRPPREPRDGPRPGAKPRKTQEELDAEMDDYWKGTTNEAPAAVSKSADDDIDMIT